MECVCRVCRYTSGKWEVPVPLHLQIGLLLNEWAVIVLKRSMRAPQVSQCTLQTTGHQSGVVVWSGAGCGCHFENRQIPEWPQQTEYVGKLFFGSSFVCELLWYFFSNWLESNMRWSVLHCLALPLYLPNVNVSFLTLHPVMTLCYT